MSQQLQWYVDRTKQLVRKLHPSLDVPDQMIRLNVHFSRNDVFRRYSFNREYLFRKTATLADGANVPADWLRYANNAVTTTGSYPAEYAPVEKLSQIKNNAIFAAYTESPKILFFNRKVNALPAATSLNVDYYWRPDDLWNSANTIDLTTESGMPQETDFAIVRGATERTVRMAVGFEAAKELIKKNELESQQAAQQWYQGTYGTNLKDVQPFVK